MLLKSGSMALVGFGVAGCASRVAAARPPFAITHSPGSMLVTDLKNSQLALF
jgi:uncharacterized protein YcsI (UPF0317 family)